MKSLIGEKFGEWLVVDYAFSKNNNSFWQCVCSCGNKKVVKGGNLKSGTSKSCGCLKKIDLTGKKFGRLTVVKLNSSLNGRRYWLCKCDCGNDKIVSQSNLTSNHTLSCGCLFKEVHKVGNPTHNLYYTRIYKIFKGMKDRCYLKTNHAYKNYGERGITICDEWLGENGIINFYNWALANGYQDDLTIDRIDNNKGYSPDNCRWVDKYTQQNNTRKNKYYEYDGEKLTLSQLSRKYNIAIPTLNRRLKTLHSVKEAIERPIDKSKSRVKKEEK